MFYHIKGTITHIEPGFTVIDAGGIGFKCNASINTLSELTVGNTVTILTYMHIREDIMDLYGFLNPEELNCFKLLLNISGVGPKAALSVLSTVTPQKLAIAVGAADEKPLMAASGIGKKLAQRIILELKDKISGDQAVSSGTAPGNAIGESMDEAASALAALGYTRSEIYSALNGIDPAGLTAEKIVKKALIGLMKP